MYVSYIIGRVKTSIRYRYRKMDETTTEIVLEAFCGMAAAGSGSLFRNALYPRRHGADWPKSRLRMRTTPANV